MKKSMYVILTVLIAITGPGAGCKNAGRDGLQKAYPNTLQTAEETVRALCDLDANGRRLSSLTWKEVRPYISWTDEPGWDTVIVISGYRVASVNEKSNSLSTVTVEYQVIGSSSSEFIPAKTVESVEFIVRKTARGWKIKSPNYLLPHVLVRPLIAHVEGIDNKALAAKLREAAKK